MGRLIDSLPIEFLELNHDSPFARGLVGWWPVGAAQHWGSSKLLDLSPFGNHGTLTNMDSATDWVYDGERAGLDFDGSNDYCATTLTEIYASARSVCAWVDLSVLTTWQKIVHKKASTSGKYVDFELAQYSDTTKYIYAISVAGSYRATSGGTIEVGKWTFVAGSWADGQPLRLYVDGSLVSTSNTVSGQIDTSTYPVYFGGKSTTGGQYLNGHLDDIRIYNRALSDAEVARLYEETRDGSYGSLVRRRRVRVMGGGSVVPPTVIVPPHLMIGM